MSDYKKFIEDETKLKVKIKYFSDNVPRLEKIAKGDWIDLYCAENTIVLKGQRALIPLGVAMKLPSGYEAHLAPRSSTIKRGLTVANSIGIIDNSYCGDNDQWFLSVIASVAPKDGWEMHPFAGKDVASPIYKESVLIKQGEKIAQFRIVENQPKFEFEEVDHLEAEDRGGFGSTGEY